jgi:Ca2+-binding EF-hand superfamily protein
MSLLDDVRSEIAEVFKVFDEENSGHINLTELAAALRCVTGEQYSRDACLEMMTKYDKDRSGEISLGEFEDLVLDRIRGHSFQDETQRAFKLFEDRELPGFVTKDSLRRAAADIGEKISEVELAEMFDPMVTGQGAQAIDFATFSAIQYAAEHDPSK